MYKLFQKQQSTKQPIRFYCLQKAQEFYEKNKDDLEEMAFCMGFDREVWGQIVEDRELIRPPICFDRVDGVKFTRDIPCFYYRFKNGVEGKMYCFTDGYFTHGCMGAFNEKDW